MVRVVLTVGIDEVGYGPSLGPLVVVAAAARGPLPGSVRIADSKKVFSQARGIGTLEPAVLGFVPAPTVADLLIRLSSRLPDVPWYAAPIALPRVPPLRKLVGAWARFVDPAEFNASTRNRNKSDFLFEIVAGLIREIRAEHRGPIRFLVGKQGGRHYYLRSLQQQVSSTVMVTQETPQRSAYQIPGATIEFLMDAEDRHKLVALASMIGKYVRESAMALFNDWWAARVQGLKRTAGYGDDARRFYLEIEPLLASLNISPDSVLRLR